MRARGCFAKSLPPFSLLAFAFSLHAVVLRGTLLKKWGQIRSCSRLEVGQKMIVSVSIFMLCSDLGLL